MSDINWKKVLKVLNCFLKKVTIGDKDVLFRLLQYSLFEESLYDDISMNQDAIFLYDYFEDYFNPNEKRDAYLIYVETNLVGFVMINTYMKKFDDGYSIAEFMIIPQYRRKGIGRKIAVDLFNMYKGNFEVVPAKGNDLAYRFWDRVIRDYTKDNFKYEDGVFMFYTQQKQKLTKNKN